MKIDVTEILKTPGAGMSFEVEGDVCAPQGPGESHGAGVFAVRGVATSIGIGVYVDAHAKGSVELICSRCLGSFTKKMELHCEAEFLENPDERLKEDPQEVGVFPLRNGVCDLGEMVRHEILLNLPMKPLCSHGCKGLCPVCGANSKRGRLRLREVRLRSDGVRQEAS
jgi:uncharacterized metal-binding protein YceD (DUF177 family)